MAHEDEPDNRQRSHRGIITPDGTRRFNAILRVSKMDLRPFKRVGTKNRLNV